MNEAPLNTLVDYTTGVRRFAGKKDLFDSFIAKFPADPNYAELQRAIAVRDYDAAFRSAHALKGIAGNLSLTLLYHAVCALVEPMRHQQYDNLSPLLAAVEQAYQDTVDFAHSIAK